MPRRGPPIKLTDNVKAQIIHAMEKGNTQQAAVKAVGMNPSYFSEWVNGEDEDQQAMKAAVDAARAKAEMRHVANIEDTAQSGVWQASAWWLERRNPEDWKKPDEHRVSGGEPIKVTLSWD